MSRRAVVIGSGPNGLAAAIALARAGVEVVVHEAADRPGGGLRSEELTLPGFVHDVCSAVHPLAVASPVFRRLDLDVEWVHPEAPCAHPLDDGTAVVLERSPAETAARLGADGGAWRRLVGPFVPLAAFRPHPAPVWLGLAPAATLARRRFAGERARALFAGLAAHSLLPLERRPSAGFGLALAALGHAVGWPFPRGGADRLAEALAARLRGLGGELVTSSPVDELPRADLVLADTSPRELARIARRPGLYAGYRHGPGAFKLDWALAGPIPWTAGECRRAGTVHLGGTAAEIARSERDAWEGRTGAPPFVLLAQPSLPARRRRPRPLRRRCGGGRAAGPQADQGPFRPALTAALCSRFAAW